MMRKKVIMIITVSIILLTLLLFFRSRILDEDINKNRIDAAYDYHYVLITDSANEDFWNAVEDSACSCGKEKGAYVDVMGRGIAANYSQNELLEIAIEAKVDGIFLEGTADDEQIVLINEAMKNDIPVVTMVNDSYGSRRLSFIGIGNYNLGREYAREVIKQTGKDTKRVVILMDEEVDDTNSNLLYNGFSDTIVNEGNHLQFETEIIQVDSRDNFSSQQTIRDVLIKDEQKPDVIICVNENTTLNAYRAVVDYNLVGRVSIIGYCASDAVLSAIEKGVICSTISLDAVTMGETAISVLNEYHTLGRGSEYLTTEARVINRENVMEYLKNDSKD